MTISGATSGVGSKSSVRILANIFITFIGAGVLGLPYAFKEAGVLEGILVMSFVGVVSVKAMLLIIDCKSRLQDKRPTSPYKKQMTVNVPGSPMEREDLLNGSAYNEDAVVPLAPGKEITYGDVGFYALGHTGTLLVELAIVISQIGFCCAYLIFISENLSNVLPFLQTYHCLMIMLPLLGCLTLLRHLSSLALSSLFAQFSTLMAFAVVFWFDFEHFSSVRLHPKEFSLEGLPFFLAIAIYCYEGAGMILSLEASVHIEKRHRFKFFFVFMMVLVTALYITFGVSGYLSFGPETNSIITLNLPKGQTLDFSLIVKICLSLSLFFTYPVMMFPVVKIIEKKISSKPAENIWLGNILRFAMVMLTGIIVMVIPNFSNMMALVGAGCCTLLAFILPGIFHMQIFKGSLTRWQWFVDAFLIGVGMVGTVIGVMDAMSRLRSESNSSTQERDNTIKLLQQNLTDAISVIKSINKTTP